MKTPLRISIRELHARTGHYIRQAAERRVIITSHGKPSAELAAFNAQAQTRPYFSRRKLLPAYTKIVKSGVLACRPGDRDVTDLISEDRDDRS